MKRLRHSLGRWLLRDAPAPTVRIVSTDATAILAALRKHKQQRGGGSLGLS